MKFKLSAYTIWEQGPRPRQEDSIFPAHNSTTPDDRLFLVCDGMGGHSAGDVASSTVCAALSSSIIASCDAEGEFTDEKFEAALSAAYDALDSKDDGSPKKMGTTLTFLKLHKAGCTIAHIGDSRVYHLRPGADAASTEIVHQTQDHSLVNDLVRIGELTPEEAKTSKQRNVITRAMQPNMERRSRADLAHTSDIRKGDYFLLCSDGILEQMEDDNLKFIFSDKGGDAQHKVEMLIKVTAGNRDNHSALLVHITDVEPEADDVPIAYEPPKGPRRRAAVATMEVEEVEVPTPSVAPVDDHGEPEDDGHDDESPLALAKRYMLPALAVVVVCLTIFFIYKSFSADDKEEAPKSTTENVAEKRTKSGVEPKSTEPKGYKVGDEYEEDGVEGIIYEIDDKGPDCQILKIVNIINKPLTWNEAKGQDGDIWKLCAMDDITYILKTIYGKVPDANFWYEKSEGESYASIIDEKLTKQETEPKDDRKFYALKVREIKIEKPQPVTKPDDNGGKDLDKKGSDDTDVDNPNGDNKGGDQGNGDS